MENNNKYHNGSPAYYYDSYGEMQYGKVYSVQENRGIAEVMRSNKMGLRSEVELNRLWPTEQECAAAKKDELMQSVGNTEDLVKLMLKHGRWEGIGELVKEVAEAKLGEPDSSHNFVRTADGLRPIADKDFEPREVVITSDGMKELPFLVRAHIKDGGKMYMMEEPKDGMTAVSASNEAGNAYTPNIGDPINMRYVAQEVSLAEDGLRMLPTNMRVLNNMGNALYMVGEPQGDRAVIATSPESSGNMQWMVPVDMVRQDEGQEFADAVSSIAAPGEEMEK